MAGMVAGSGVHRPVGADAGGVGAGATDQCLEHGGAGIDGVDVDAGVGAEQAGGEAAVAVAEDESAAGGGELIEEGESGSGEERAEGDPLHPTIEAGEGIEVGGRGHLTMSRRAGVRRARSAAARRVKGVRRARKASRRARRSAAAAAARRSAATRGAAGRIAARNRAARAMKEAIGKIVRRVVLSGVDSQRSMAWQLSQARRAKNTIAAMSGQRVGDCLG